MNKRQKKTLTRIILSAAIMILLSGFQYFFRDLLDIDPSGWLKFFAYLVPYILVGYDILLKAWKGIKHRQPFDENFLMAVASIGAIVLGRVRTGDYAEGAAVMLFYQIGELFQSVAIGKSRRNISALMDIRPDSANLETEAGQVETVDPDEVETGSILVVRTGEKVPIDGIVVEGTSSLDTSALTGESVPRTVREGDEVLSGCINQQGLLRIRTTREFGDSTASKILDLVENASSRKSRPEAFITKFARIYTPAVCFAALALALLPPLFLLLTGQSADWGDWIMRALTFLVISCPCALVISIPLTFFAGIGGASSSGILVKGSNYFEGLAKIGTVVFDKTGTMTEGVFEVSGVHHAPAGEQYVLRMAALAESYSTHPIAQSLRRACGAEISRDSVTDVREISGQGVIATVEGHQVAAGNEKLMDAFSIQSEPCSSVGTVVHVAVDGVYQGHILIADQVKPAAAATVEALHQLGIGKTVMLTGDHQKAAQAVAAEIGMDEVYAELLPEDKLRKVEELMQAQTGRTLAFVGDGINDAPVLSRADLGIAMGALGSDAAIEAADVVLMDDNPLKVAKAIRIARKCLRIAYQNIVFAIAVKLICLVLGALGIASMWLAIFADVGVMVLAVLNAVRALRVKNL
ncbi:MAG: cadmium-translocating P-type ATPase [Clostridia bacterium]|nr:cadmium-translocating P-type ATPase [Clostridia bacterium]